MDKVDNRRIECMVCASCTVWGNGGIMEEKLREEDAGEGEGGQNG